MSIYTFLDVETPNRRNNRICSIGIEQTDDCGSVKYSEHFYVNPEQGFDYRNIELHGIAPADVMNERTFSELWRDEIGDILNGSIYVAHNVSFDLGVIGKTLDYYGLEKPAISYIDTIDLATHLLSLDDYKLPTICAHYEVPLISHHNALSDAHACNKIFWNMVDEFDLAGLNGVPWHWKNYNPLADKSSSCDQAMTDLYGITLGIAADKRILPEELQSLTNWMIRNEHHKRSAFLHEAFALLDQVLEDGIVSEPERISILNLTRPFVLNGHNSQNTIKTQTLIGVLRGISCDGRINAREAEALQEWIEDLAIQGNASVEKLRQKLTNALEDGEIDASEEEELLALCQQVIDPMTGYADSNEDKLQGEGVAFQGNRFVLTGNFTKGSKKAVEAFIEACGGEIAKNVSKKVAYLVVGGEGSEAYSCGNYGTKIQKAMDLQEKGCAICIIAEEQLGM